MSSTTTLPDSVDDLTTLVIKQQKKLDHQSLFIEQLLEQIKLAKHHRFGANSEAISPDQLRLLLDELEATEPVVDSEPDNLIEPALQTPASKAKRGRRALPPHLPRVEIKHTLDEGSCQCEHCSQRMVPLSEKITEQLDIIPAKVRVLRHHRTTYQCPACKDAFKTASLPPQPIQKSNAAPSLLAYLIIAKYLDGMPLYRLQRKLKRYGMPLSRSTQASWMIGCGQLVQPLINLMRDRLLSYDIIAMDESRYQVLKEDGKTPQSQSYIWVQRGGPPESPVILYDYDPTRT